MPYDVFISYASEDIAFAQELNDHLVTEGFKVWFDKARLAPGFDWYKEIEQGCENSRVLLPVLTPHWKNSEWTKFETYGAEAVIPILFEGSWTEVVTPPLERFQAEIIDIKKQGGINWSRLYIDIRKIIDSQLIEKTAHLTHLHYRANEYFIGREKELIHLHEELHSKPKAGLTTGRVRAITATGGAGKTTLVRQYVEKFWRCYPQIFWIDCRVGFEVEFANIHDILFPQRSNIGLQDSNKAVSALYELSGNKTRLLILDNAEDETSTMKWIPMTGGCHTIITSRFAGWSSAIKTICIYVLEKEPSIEFLQKRSGRFITDSEIKDCENLAEQLGYLPLALEQAAAYIGQQEDSFRFADYLNLYIKATCDLLAIGALGSTEYPDSVITTWKPTIEKLMPGARTILRLSSYLAPVQIPIKLMIDGAQLLLNCTSSFDNKSSWSQPLNMEIWVRTQIANLKAYSLVRIDGQSILFHPLLQAVEKYYSSIIVSNNALKTTITLFMNHAPHESYRYPNNIIWRSLVSHAEALWQEVTQLPSSEWDLELPKALSLFYMDSMPSEKGISIQRLVLTESLQRYGALSSESLLAKNDLALMLDASGKNYNEALQLYHEALEGRRKVHGDVSLEVAETLSNLCYMLQNTESSETEKMLHEAIEIHSQTSGPEHWRTLSVMSTLAAFLCHHGKYDASEKLCKEVLSIRERLFSLKSADTLSSYKDLAYILYSKGNIKSALDYCRIALVGFEEVEGKEHPDTLNVLQMLADILESSGDPDEAKSIRLKYLTALSDKSNTPPLLLRGFALDYFKLGNYAKAEELLRKLLLNGFEKAAMHHHLARICLITDRIAEASEQVEQGLKFKSVTKAYVVARLLWFKIAIEYLKGSAIDHSGQLKVFMQKEGSFMEWTMQPVLDHIKPQITEHQHAFLTALVDALSNKANLEKLNDFNEWRDAIPEEIE